MSLVRSVIGPLASSCMTSGMTRRTTVKTVIGATGALALGVPALSGSAAAAGTSDESADRAQATPLPDPVLHYRAPAADWERESLPVGGGALGASVWGTLASERLTFNEKTLWTGGPGSAEGYDFGNWTTPRPGALDDVRDRLDAEGVLGPDAVAAELGQARRGYGAYQVFGELRLDIPGAPAAPDASYRRSLNLRTALATVTYTHEGAAHTREYFASHPGGVIGGRLAADRPGRVAFTLRYTSPRDDFTATAKGDRLTVRGALSDNGLRFEAQIRVRTMRRHGHRQPRRQPHRHRSRQRVVPPRHAAPTTRTATPTTGARTRTAGSRQPSTPPRPARTRRCATPTRATTAPCSTGSCSTSASSSPTYPPTSS